MGKPVSQLEEKLLQMRLREERILRALDKGYGFIKNLQQYHYHKGQLKAIQEMINLIDAREGEQ